MKLGWCCIIFSIEFDIFVFSIISHCVHFINVQWKPFNGLINDWWDSQILPFEPGKICVQPCISQYRADWLKLCDERLQKIHSNKLNLEPYTPQTTTSETRTREPNYNKKARSAEQKSFFETLNREIEMILLCALVIIAPVHAIQNQEMPEVEMFVRHSIGGYHLLSQERLVSKYSLLAKFWSLVNPYWNKFAGEIFCNYHATGVYTLSLHNLMSKNNFRS